MAPLLHNLLVFLLFLSAVAADDPLGHFCPNQTNVTAGQISANIDRLLSALVSNASADGYASASYGKGQDVVYGLAQCRGDVGAENCSSCVKAAAEEVRRRCGTTQPDARIWYDFCILRYAPEDFVGRVSTSPAIFYLNVENVTDPKGFEEKLGGLMSKVSADAVSASSRGLGKGETALSPLRTLYALAQCTRDLAPLGCAQCVDSAVKEFGGVCKGREGCRVLYSSCYVRYELYRFFFPLNSSSAAAAAAALAVRPTSTTAVAVP